MSEVLAPPDLVGGGNETSENAPEHILPLEPHGVVKQYELGGYSYRHPVLAGTAFDSWTEHFFVDKEIGAPTIQVGASILDRYRILPDVHWGAISAKFKRLGLNRQEISQTRIVISDERVFHYHSGKEMVGSFTPPNLIEVYLRTIAEDLLDHLDDETGAAFKQELNKRFNRSLQHEMIHRAHLARVGEKEFSKFMDVTEEKIERNKGIAVAAVFSASQGLNSVIYNTIDAVPSRVPLFALVGAMAFGAAVGASSVAVSWTLKNSPHETYVRERLGVAHTQEERSGSDLITLNFY